MADTTVLALTYFEIKQDFIKNYSEKLDIWLLVLPVTGVMYEYEQYLV